MNDQPTTSPEDDYKRAGAKHLSAALAKALSLNIEAIAESITAAISGGSAEGWRQMAELSYENARLIEKRLLEMQIKRDNEELQQILAEIAALIAKRRRPPPPPEQPTT